MRQGLGEDGGGLQQEGGPPVDHLYPGLALTDSLKAIANARRTAWDKWMRKQWHKAAARERRTGSRRAKWADWRRRGSRGAVAHAARHDLT